MSEEEKKPVSSIDIARALNSSFKEESTSVQDLIMEQAKKAGVMPGGKSMPHVRSAAQVGDKLNLDSALPKIPPIEINGHELPRTNIPQMDALTVIMFLLATEFSRNKRIRSILDQIQFSFADMNGNKLYPPPHKTRQTKKNRNDKSK
jgi:hypothetical protein